MASFCLLNKKTDYKKKGWKLRAPLTLYIIPSCRSTKYLKPICSRQCQFLERSPAGCDEIKKARLGKEGEIRSVFNQPIRVRVLWGQIASVLDGILLLVWFHKAHNCPKLNLSAISLTKPMFFIKLKHYSLWTFFKIGGFKFRRSTRKYINLHLGWLCCCHNTNYVLLLGS